jgi:hypothetical protein
MAELVARQVSDSRGHQPAGLLIATLIIAWSRKEQIRKLLSN